MYRICLALSLSQAPTFWGGIDLFSESLRNADAPLQRFNKKHGVSRLRPESAASAQSVSSASGNIAIPQPPPSRRTAAQKAPEASEKLPLSK